MEAITVLTLDTVRRIIEDVVRTTLIEVLDERSTTPFDPIQRQTVAQHFTRREVMDLLRVSHPTLRRMEKRGELVPVRIGRRVLYDSKVVGAMLERKGRSW